jgi:hypothetical protein
MRCLNCLTVCADTDTRCISCGAPIRSPSYKQKTQQKPFFAVVFMLLGSAGYNFLSPPAQAVASNGGQINVEHAMMAGVGGGFCALFGGLLDWLLGGERKR